MPTAPKRRQTPQGRVSKEHPTRANSYQRGYNKRWQAARLHWIKQYMFCEPCTYYGEFQVAECVDHIIPHRGNKELFWDSDNWQSMCHRCHSKKTYAEREVPAWHADSNRVIVCGLPATGKTTLAKEIQKQQGGRLWDLDVEAEKLEWYKPYSKHALKRLLQMRDKFAANVGPAVMIVSHCTQAMRYAHKMRARLVHCVCDENEREQRLMARPGRADQWI